MEVLCLNLYLFMLETISQEDPLPPYVIVTSTPLTGQ